MSLGINRTVGVQLKENQSRRILAKRCDPINRKDLSPLYSPPPGLWGLLVLGAIGDDKQRTRNEFRAGNRRGPRILFATCVAAVFATTAFAAVFSDFFGRDRRLNEKDLGLLQDSIRRVLDQRMQGASAQWQDEETGESGRVSVLRLYEQDGRPCAEVEHLFTGRSPFRYLLRYCRQNDEWKMAF